MSERVIAYAVRMIDNNDVERSGLELVLTNSTLIYRDAEGTQYQRKQLLAAEFLMSHQEAVAIIARAGGL